METIEWILLKIVKKIKFKKVWLRIKINTRTLIILKSSNALLRNILEVLSIYQLLETLFVYSHRLHDKHFAGKNVWIFLTYSNAMIKSNDLLNNVYILIT